MMKIKCMHCLYGKIINRPKELPPLKKGFVWCEIYEADFDAIKEHKCLDFHPKDYKF